MGKFVFVRGAVTWWPVKWFEPADGGVTVENTIQLRFKRTPWGEEVDALYKLDVVPFIEAVATDWRGIIDDADRPVAFEADAIAEMAGRPAFGEAVGAAYLEFLRAVPATRLGNSEASLAGGPAAGQELTADGALPATPA